jgi:hypothetical protein
MLVLGEVLSFPKGSTFEDLVAPFLDFGLEFGGVVTRGSSLSGGSPSLVRLHKTARGRMPDSAAKSPTSHL